ncbi:hypothetical protein [Streptomyces albipurpureus]|uniref:Uncharacterized protein n=1 Tax=Streptomyces albipurpureus TaxID=2897419 RepID=A0ABT0UL35_9ACTN|nr:hypothetical protein [Streptomyces sp. CWNU-1]MCM2388330.1 hypothetical protein [Streptomyces sp. CWNU-1]
MPQSTSKTSATQASGRGKAAQLAPLKSGLPAEKQALAEDLRALFGALEVSVRRYGVRRHLDASCVTRYLSGDRVPPWNFVAALIGDVGEASAPLTAQAEAALKETHRAALASNRRSSEVQKLQDQLEAVDEEARRIQTRQRALEEALLNREGRLAETVGRCRRLEMQLDSQQSAHRAEVALWEGEYEQLHAECRDLRVEMLFLQEELAVTRAELIGAEEQCRRLEADLDARTQLEEGSGSVSSLMAALEAADRTASVQELVAVIEDLESRTHQAMARELVSSVSRSRRVEEVAALLAGLQQAGLHAHTEAALPALLMTRPVAESAALAVELQRAGLEDCVATLLRASVELHTPRDMAGFALVLHREHLGELAESLLAAAYAVRAVTDVVALAVDTLDTRVEEASVAALARAVGHRSVPRLVELHIALRNAGQRVHADALNLAIAGQRDARDVVEAIRLFTARGRTDAAEQVLDATQSRAMTHVLGLVQSLERTGWHEAATAVVDQALQRRSVTDIAAMIADFYTTDHHYQATQTLISAMSTPCIPVAPLFHELGKIHPGAEAVVTMAAATGSSTQVAQLLTCLHVNGLPLLVEVVVQHTLCARPTGHAGSFLHQLSKLGAAYTREAFLYDRACAAVGADMAPWLLALDAACLPQGVDAVVRGCLSDKNPGDLVLLVKQLRALDHPITPRAPDVIACIIARVVETWSVEDQATWVIALSEADLKDDANKLVQQAAGQAKFRSTLRSAQTKHTQKVFSRAFWRDDSRAKRSR